VHIWVLLCKTMCFWVIAALFLAPCHVVLCKIRNRGGRPPASGMESAGSSKRGRTPARSISHKSRHREDGP
jgi:hypothetical protein